MFCKGSNQVERRGTAFPKDSDQTAHQQFNQSSLSACRRFGFLDTHRLPAKTDRTVRIRKPTFAGRTCNFVCVRLICETHCFEVHGNQLYMFILFFFWWVGEVGDMGEWRSIYIVLWCFLFNPNMITIHGISKCIL